MNPLPLPTDNLYKFCALAGLALIFFSLWASWSATNQLFKLQGQQELANDRANIETDFWSHEKAIIKREYSDLVWNQNNENNAAKEQLPKEKLRVPLNTTEFTKHLDSLLGSGKLALLNEAEVKWRYSEIELMANERMIILWVTVAGILTGLGMSLYGFRNWRILQLHHDKNFLAQERHSN